MGFDLGDVEQVVDQDEEGAGGELEGGDVLGLPLGERTAEGEDIGQADDGAHGGAQFVAHVGEEFGFHQVGAVGDDAGLVGLGGGGLGEGAGFLGVLEGDGEQVLDLFPLGDVADVALDDFLVAGLVDVADELDGDVASVLGLQGEVLVADVAVLLEALEHGLVGDDVLEGAELADGLADHLVVGEAEELEEEGIDVGDAAGADVEEEDAVSGGLEKAAVAELGGAEGLAAGRVPVLTIAIPALFLRYIHPLLHHARCQREEDRPQGDDDQGCISFIGLGFCPTRGARIGHYTGFRRSGSGGTRFKRS